MPEQFNRILQKSQVSKNPQTIIFQLVCKNLQNGLFCNRFYYKYGYP
jgi:hypothetical protein